MRRLVIALALLSVYIATPATQSQPKLVVIVVLDQFRAEYLTTFASHWRDGFKTLLADGAVFTRAQYPYLKTDTCAGHFTIGTGTMPRTHGMVSDIWWDREAGRNIDCTDDDRSPLVTYGKEARGGRSARRSLVPSLADELRAQRPGGRVVTLSMKARAAIGLAGHAGDAVTWFEEGAGVGAFVTSRAFAESPVPAVRTFLTRDLFENDFGKTWLLRDPGDAYRNADAGVGERPRAPWTGVFPHDIKSNSTNAATIRDEQVALWRGSPFSDGYLARMAIDLIDAYQLGNVDGTDFLGVSFSAADLVGHPFGPRSREVEDTVARQDDAIGSLITHLDRRVGRANYVLALAGDHGVADVPVMVGTGRVAAEDVRERIEETLRMRWGPPPSGTPRYVVAATDFVRLSEGTFERLQKAPEVMNALERAVVAIPGVERVLRRDQLSLQSSDATVRAAALSYVEGRSGDLIIVTKPRWTMGARATAEAGTHGAPYDYDQHVPLILLGAGIRPGSYNRPVTPADIAPTLARVAGVRLPQAEGRVLIEALRE